MNRTEQETNDAILATRSLARRIITHFRPHGRVLDPARGDGILYDQIGGEKDWCEISMGRNFFDYRSKANCIITSPPLSLFRQFLVRSMELADDIYFLIIVNLVWTKTIVQDMRGKDFGIKEIFLVDAPTTFHQSGLQVGVVHFKRGWHGDIRLSTDDGIEQGLFSFFNC